MPRHDPDDLPQPDAELLGELALVDDDPEVLDGMAKLATLRELEAIEFRTKDSRLDD